MFDRRLLKNFDWKLLGCTMIMCIVGIIILYSAVNAGGSDYQKSLYFKQIIWYSVGFVLMMVCCLIDYKIFEQWAYFIYGACIILLIAVLLYGRLASGSRRWIVIGHLTLQPSELAKIGVVLMLAKYYSKLVKKQGFSLRDLVTPAIFIMLPFTLILKQPDLGTAMLIMLIAGTITVFVKIKRRSLIYIISGGLLAIPLVWYILKDYQKQRVLTFLDPERDPLGAGYHLIQSKIAIGSGALFGKGFLQGTQSALMFLPEQHTDFIFSVMAEEWGFVGAASLLILFILLITICLSAGHKSRDPFGIILSIGLTSIIAWQVVINIGMVMGLMPVVGVPLPFISYGGSSVVSTMICIGLLLNISMRRFMIK